MEFLVDTNVLSEALKPAPDPLVVKWLRMHERHLAVDPIILGELRFGILRLPAGKRKREMESWFDAVVSRIHCVSWDAEFGYRWAKLVVDLRARGKAMPIQDSLIATTALMHDLTVVTRNESDFAHCGVRLLNPFQR